MANNIENSLILVLTSDDTNKNEKVIAKIIRRMDETTYVVNYLVPSSKLYEDYCTMYKFSSQLEVVEDESICTWFDSNNIEEIGYKMVDKNSYITMDDWEDMDDDYEPTTSEEETSDEESLVDSEFSDSDSDEEKQT